MSEARLKLAFFVPATASFAGIEQVTHQLATALATDHGDILDVHVVYGARYEDDYLVETRYRSHWIGSRKLRDVPFTLGRFLRRTPFDVFVCPQVTASVFARIATIGCGIPIFITHLHGNVEKEAVASRMDRLLFALFRHVVSPTVAALLAVSPTQAAHAAKMGLGPAPVRFTKNPVRVFADTSPLPRDDDTYRFVNVAGLVPRKGQIALLDAFAEVLRRRPNARLALVGRGGDEAALKARARDLGLDGAVEFCGYLSDPSDRYRRSDCFVLSSRDEGFGLVLVEALSCGLPIVSTDCLFGPSDVVTDPRLGTLVPVDDAAAMAAAMIQRMDTPDGEEDRAFRRRVAADYRPAVAASMFLDVLREITADREPSPGRARHQAPLQPRGP
ncbi:MAG: glycosyltransferase [Siculibacillus sp.]|nr:glycosyltransferase [Siculibacillus sp.]